MILTVVCYTQCDGVSDLFQTKHNGLDVFPSLCKKVRSYLLSYMYHSHQTTLGKSKFSCLNLAECVCPQFLL